MTYNPYAPPGSRGDAPERPREPVHVPGQYTPVVGLGIAVIAAIGAYVLLRATVHVIDLVVWNDILAGRPVPNAAVVETLCNKASIVARVAGIVLFLVWVYLAARNTNALGRPRIDSTPAMAVIWFFVPVASLWMPYRVMSEMSACSNAKAPGVAPASVLAWWLLFLLQNLVTGTIGFLSKADITTRVAYSALGTVVAGVAAVAMGIVVMAISRGQSAIRAGLGA
jgi:hypothetical protein